MKLVVALGIAAATTAMAYAQEPHAMRVMIHGPGMDLNLDANHDGWISRDEAAAAADRMFDQLDTNHDGRLTADDHEAMGDHGFMAHGPDGMDLPPGHHCTTTTDNTQSSDSGHRTERRLTIVCEGDDDHPAAAPAAPGQRVERNVMIITRSDGDATAPPAPPEAPMPPYPPHAPHPPMFMMLLARSSEADRNGDGALSRDEFRAQQLRFFDAADANGDHRIRAPAPPPEPPQPPEPPEPPAPPAPH